MRTMMWRSLALATVIVLALSGIASAEDTGFDDGVIDSSVEIHNVGAHQHGGDQGHLPATQANVDVVGKLKLRQTEAGRVADVGSYGNYAYLAAFDDGDCQNGGVWIVDIKNPARPRQVGFVKAANNSYVGEGIHVIRIDSASYHGDVLLYNNEICGAENSGAVGGITLVDVTDPLHPRKLVDGFGDFTNGDGSLNPRAHTVHSTFGWTVGAKSYAVLQDNEEEADVDILDISNPRQPVLISESDLDIYNVDQAELKLTSSFHHDVIVKKIGTVWTMLVSHWDGGYVQLNVNNPARPRFIGDTDYAALDPEQLARGNEVLPEGNGHQAEFVRDNSMFIATDEDFGPYKVKSTITSGPNTGHEFQAVQGSNVPQIGADTTLTGQSVFVGLACSPLPPAPAGVEIAIVERGVCLFTEKIANVEAAGYQGGIVFNRTGVDGCEDLIFMDVTGSIPFVFISRTDGFRILNAYDPATYTCSVDGSGTAAPAVGVAGADLDLSAFFDGWGYVHLFDRKTFTDLDTYSIPEAQDAAYAQGFGDLSVHEVATDPDTNLAYFSYYSGGFRVARYSRSTGITEVGRYIAEGGNNFWGVQVHRVPATGQKLVLASDRDYGLFIFRYTGP
jgi:hypothetical protein